MKTPWLNPNVSNNPERFQFWQSWHFWQFWQWRLPSLSPHGVNPDIAAPEHRAEELGRRVEFRNPRIGSSIGHVDVQIVDPHRVGYARGFLGVLAAVNELDGFGAALVFRDL